MTTLRMLCRALLAAAILSYVLCVLLLSGVQKEDLDAATLRKLQRHNVNIDDINDPKLQEQCLSETNASAVQISLQQRPFEKTLTEKTITLKDITSKNVGKSTKRLRKILEYFKNRHKEENSGVFESINTAKTSQDIISLITTTPPNMPLFDCEHTNKVKNTTGKKRMTINNKNVKDENMTKDLENLMNIWKSNFDNIHQQSTTLKTIRDNYVSQNAKDIEYISKIVAKLISNKQLSEVKTTTRSKHRVKETPRYTYEISTAQTVKKTIIPTNYYLNNCKLEKIYKRLNSGTTVPVKETENLGDNFNCKKVDSNDKETVHADHADENTINSILTKLKKENRRIHVIGSGNVNAIETALQNQPKKMLLSRENEHVRDNNYKNGKLNILDNESAKALEVVLENQSNRVKINQLSEPMNDSSASTYQEISNPLDNASDKEFESASSFDQHVIPIHTTKMYNDKYDIYASFIEESKRIWKKYFENQSTGEPKLEKKRTQTITTPPYKPNKQHVQHIDDAYKTSRFTFPSPLNTERLMAEDKIKSLLDNIANDHQKLTQIQSSVQYNSDTDKQYKSPWLYDTVRNKNPRYENENKEILHTVLFKPQYDEKITNTIDEKVTYRIRSPYFDAFNKNISKDHNSYKKPIWFHKDMLLKQPNYLERSHDLKDTSKNVIGWYRNKTPFTLKLVESNEDRNFNQVRSQTSYYNKNDWPYIRNKLSTKHNPNKEYDEETEHFINSPIRMNYNYNFPPKPHEMKAKENRTDDDHSRNNLFKYISREKNIHNTDIKETVKLPSFPPNVLKDIANSVKEIVLRDLKATVSTEINVTPITTTASPTTIVTTTPITTTTTPATTTTTPMTTTSTVIATTTTPMEIAIIHTSKTTTISDTIKHLVGASTITSEEGPLKIQDASKMLDKLMEMFDKIHSLKSKMGYDNVDHMRQKGRVGYDLITTEALTIDRDDTSVQDKLENFASHDQSAGWQIGNGNPEYHYHSKIGLDRYDLLEKKILEKTTANLKVKNVPKQHVVMVQTNSGEIAPLPVALNKPFIQNVVLTTRAPVTDEIVIRSYNLSPPRHGVDNNKNIQQDSQAEQTFARHQNRDAYLKMPKERQIEKKTEFPIIYKRREQPMIGKFNEKFDKNGPWPPYNEKIPHRIQQPIAKKSKYNDVHFRNFLHTQQKVNAMLENILSSAKNKPTSGQVI